ncbi:uncharacterized protein LOC128231953 isoform X2 [Mya arenaria]|uniref:uncharacterized protein LOC128231953 isoform X2 n=1 Tax=Mya arenaria TaxID=6604 RepID=UPI0022E3EE58|nr:uncharacterized protein LOC128231953 isoform X2 [Mya arenaria]
MAGIMGVFDTVEAQNWQRQWKAVFITRKAILPSVKSAASLLHAHIATQAQSQQANIYSQDHGHHDILRDEIRKQHKQTPSWKNAPSNTWNNDAFSVAKLFMSPSGYDGKSSFEQTDFNGIADFICNCRRFPDSVEASVVQARVSTNMIRHMPSMCLSALTDQATNGHIDNLAKLLNEPRFSGDRKVQEALNQLYELKTTHPELLGENWKYVIEDISIRIIQDIHDLCNDEMESWIKEADKKKFDFQLLGDSIQCELRARDETLFGDIKQLVNFSVEAIAKAIEDGKKIIEKKSKIEERNNKEQTEIGKRNDDANQKEFIDLTTRHDDQSRVRNETGSRSASTFEKLDKVPSERELVTIAQTIGSGWQLLATMLGVKKPAVERIILDNLKSLDQIRSMLQHWKQEKAHNATFRALLSEIKKCPNVTIDLEEIKGKLGIDIEVLNHPEPPPKEAEAQNTRAHNEIHAQRVESGLSEENFVMRLQKETRFGDTTDMPPLSDLISSFEGLSKDLVMVMQRFRESTARLPRNESNVGGTGVMPGTNEPRFGATQAMQSPKELDLAMPPLHSALTGHGSNYVNAFRRDLLDGRLISLNESQIEDILNGKRTLAARDGAQVFATSNKIPGFNIKMVIKKLHIDRDDLDTMRSITNARLASRILHYGIVPLIAFHDALHEDQSRTHGFFYFVSPYFEGGDLMTAIAEDTNALLRKETSRVRMSQRTRLKIINQVASAICYLHTPVGDFRHGVLHMNIKSSNIVLDMNNNARLINFGLEREMKEPDSQRFVTSSPLAGTVGYFPTTTCKGLTKFHDYHYFGVVISELLTGISPVEMCCTLQTMSSLRLQDKIQTTIWKRHVWTPLLDLAQRCVESLIQHAAAKTFQISDMLKELDSLMRGVDERSWTRSPGLECEMCLVNQAAHESKFLKHDVTCRSPIRMCASCMRNSFMNPIMCHSCKKNIQPLIGENLGAILIAGNDMREILAEVFINDVYRLKAVITSRSVPVMCIREENVSVVTPDEPGKEDNKMWCKVQNAFEKLNKQNLKTLIVVYSGNYGFQTRQKNAKIRNQSIDLPKSVTGSAIEDNVSLFKLSENELMKDVELSNEVQKLTTVDKIVLFDCYADIRSAFKGKTVVQFNSSTSMTSAVPVNIKKKESTYIGALIKALTASEGTKHELYEHTDCTRCKDIADTLFIGNFLTVNSLQTFIESYIEHTDMMIHREIPSVSVQNLSSIDAILAYRYQFPLVPVQVKIKTPKGVVGEIELTHLNYFDNVNQLREFLLRRILGNDESTKYLVIKEDQMTACAAAVSIGLETGTPENHLKEIKSLEQVTSAWKARIPLIAQLRNVSKIGFQNYDAADIVSPNDVEDIFKEVSSVPPDLCSHNPSEDEERFIVDANNLGRCVDKLEKRRGNEQGRLDKVFFDFYQSLDIIDSFLRNKHEDVSDVKVHIVFPKNNVEGVRKFWPFIYYHLE